MATNISRQRVPITTLRDWLDYLAAHERLRILRDNINLKYELAAIAKQLEGAQATLYPSPSGHPVPVVCGVIANRHWIAECLGVEYNAMHKILQHALGNPIPWKEVQSAPVQEIVHRDIDLCKLLPIPTHAELDSAPYLAAGMVVTRNPVTGAQNVSMNRCQVTGPNRLGLSVATRGTGTFLELAEKAGQPLPAAIVIGADPLTLVASQMIARFDLDELEIAGALHGAPLPVVKCLTSDLRVPSNAEIVIEGRFLPNVREPEGPFAEFTGYYGVRDNRPVLVVDAITHRRSPIFQTLLGGGMEHILLGAVPREASILSQLQVNFPNVSGVQLSMGGVGRFHLHIQANIGFLGEAKNIMFGAFAAHHDIKQVIVVDQDVDITKPEEVEWAVATRFQANHDLIVIPEARSQRFDPSAPSGLGSKIGLDATKALAGGAEFKRIWVPGQDRVDVKKMTADVKATDWRRTIGLPAAGH